MRGMQFNNIFVCGKERERGELRVVEDKQREDHEVQNPYERRIHHCCFGHLYFLLFFSIEERN